MSHTFLYVINILSSIISYCTFIFWDLHVHHDLHVVQSLLKQFKTAGSFKLTSNPEYIEMYSMIKEQE